MKMGGPTPLPAAVRPGGALRSSVVPEARRQPFSVVSFFIELGFDVGLPDGSSLVLLEEETPFSGWDGLPWRPTPGMPPLPGAGGPTPSTSIFYRRVSLRTRPFRATDLAFGSVIHASRGRRSLRVARRLRARVVGVRSRESQTVVHVMRLTAEPVAAAGEIDTDCISKQFDICLATLNQHLTSIAIVAQDVGIGPVSRRDLPALIPCLVSQVTGGSVTNSSLTFVLHWNVPHEKGIIPPSLYSAATRLTVDTRMGRAALAPFGEQWLAANRALSEGRLRVAVLEAQTAMELLINSLIREGGPALGYDELKVTGILAAPFKSRVADHLGTICGAAVRIDDRDNAFGHWWQTGYALRNRVSKEGYTPSAVEAQDALDSVGAAAEQMGRGLAQRPETRDLGSMLSTEPTPYEPLPADGTATAFRRRVVQRLRRREWKWFPLD